MTPSVPGMRVSVEEAYPVVRRLCAHLLRNADEAEEAAQDAMVRLQSSLDQYRGEGPWLAWVRAITLNVVRKRRRGRRLKRESADFEAIPSGRLTPPDHASKRELEAKVKDALDRLPDEYREALVLREVEGLTYREIAEVQDVPLGTVKSRLHNGTVLLGKELKKRR